MASTQKGPPGTKDNPSQSNKPEDSVTNKPGGKKNDVRNLGSKINSYTGSIHPSEVKGAATNHPEISITKITPPKTEGHPASEEQSLKSSTVSQQNTRPTTAVSGGPAKEEQNRKISTTDPHTTPKTENNDAHQKHSTVSVPPSGEHLSQSSARTTRFAFSKSSYDITSMKMPTAAGGGSFSEGAATVSSTRPGILKRSSSPPNVGARQSLQTSSEVASSQLVDIPLSASSSTTNLRSESTRTLSNRRSRERMLKRIERMGPRVLTAYSPSGSITIPPESQHQSTEAKSQRSSTSSRSSVRKSSDVKESKMATSSEVIKPSNSTESEITTIPGMSRRKRISLQDSGEQRSAIVQSSHSHTSRSNCCKKHKKV